MKIHFLLILLIAGHFLQGQNIGNEQFEKAVDYLNCKTTEFSLKDHSSLAKFKAQCTCEKQISYATLLDFLKNEKIDATTELSQEIDKLKHEFKPNQSIDNVVEFLSVGAFDDNNKFQKLYAFENKKGRKASIDYKDFKSKLKEGLFTLLKNEEVKAQNEIVSGLENKVNELENKLTALEQRESAPKKSSGLIDQIKPLSVLISIIISILIFLLFFRRSKGNSTTDNSIPDKDWVLRKIQEAQFLPSSRNEQSSDLRIVKNEISDLKSLLNQLERKVDRKEGSTHDFERPSVAPSYSDFQRSDTLYFSTPDTDGTFNESSGHTSYKEGASIYKLSRISNDKGEFQIDERESSIKLALQYPDKNIDPVCEAVNAFNPRAKSISTVEGGAGLVELIGGKWKVNKKAKIRYDN